MIHDLEAAGELLPGPFDVCIVGAGAAGIALAVELRRSGLRVLLLEAGGLDVEAESQDPYRAEVTGLPHAGVHEGRFRALGGSTTRWGGQILEFDDLDFAERPWVDGSGWPIGKAELQPYYDRAIHLEGLDRVFLDDRQVTRSVGLAWPDFGEDFEYAYSRWCPERNFARLHGDLIRRDPHLTVYVHANLCELVLEADGRSVREARCRTLSGREARFAAGRFVLCMGGIETARFLLQPAPFGLPLATTPHPLLGRWFQDHIVVKTATVRGVSLHPPLRYFDYVRTQGHKYHPKMKLSAAAQRRLNILNVGATMSYVEPPGAEPRSTAARLPRLARRYAHQLMSGGLAWRPPSAETRLTLHCEQSPRSRSRVGLTDSRDATGLLRASIDWRVDDAEIRSLQAVTTLVADTFAERGLGQVTPDPDVAAGDDSFVARFEDCYHHMGGARMASSARDGVVDPDLKMFGSDNVYICSSAVFPTSGFSNPTHTLIALAARLGAHLSATASAARSGRVAAAEV